MAKNKMADLRNHLFEALERLNDTSPSNEMKIGLEIDRAKAICQVAQTVINTAKVEVDYLRTLNQGEHVRSEFIELAERPPKPALPSPRPAAPAAATPPRTNGHSAATANEVKRGLSTGKHLGAE